MTIESFETSKSAVFGDLLSVRKADKALKVGFLAGAFFEFFRMWGEDYERQIYADAEVVAGNLRQRFENLVYPGLCDTLDKCAAAGDLFKREEVDVVVLCEMTYFPDYMPLEALGRVRDAELIIFSTQSEPIMRPDIDYGQAIRDSAIIGLVQFAGAIRAGLVTTRGSPPRYRSKTARSNRDPSGTQPPLGIRFLAVST